MRWRSILQAPRLSAMALAGLLLLPRVAAAAPPAPSARRPPAPPGLAETLTGQAKVDYEVALTLLRDGDFAGALVKFQAAYDASKDPRLLFNLAVCEKSMRHYARAVGLLKQFAVDPSPLIPAGKREEATDLAKTFEQFTIALTVTVNEPDAEVEVDDRVIGKTPLAEPVLVDIGSRKIRVRKEGFRESTTTALVGGSPTHIASIKLEKEVHEGKLVVSVPVDAHVEIDGKAVPHGVPGAALEITLVAGGHTLRVTAPGMRTYEREVVVKDKETRAVEVRLEAAAAAEKPRLRVAVGCGTRDIRGVEDGLVVTVDGSSVPARALRDAKHHDQSLDKTVLDYVEFEVEPGNRQVHVELSGCHPRTIGVAVPEQGTVDVRGTLEESLAFMRKGPAAMPDWFRLLVGAWVPWQATTDRGPPALRSNGFGGLASTYNYALTGVGAVIESDYVGQYWTAGIQGAYASGHAEFANEDAGTVVVSNLYPETTRTTPSLHWVRGALHLGARAPLAYVTLSGGVRGGYQFKALVGPAAGFQTDNKSMPFLAGWGTVDIHPYLCEWLLFASFDAGTSFTSARFPMEFSGALGVGYQPNSHCKELRDKAPPDYGLRAGADGTDQSIPR